tara:strand:+ start:2039 stop:2602 length:564 start_codon:yes stop_codon:yes gene_type:complete
MNIFDDFNLIKFKNQKPPTDNSLTTLKEIKDIDNLNVDEKFVKYYDGVENVFKNVIEKNGYEYPKDLVTYLVKFSRPTIISLKNYHGRSRPNEIAKNYNIDLDVVDLKSAKTKAYPSGHSAQAELIGLVLSDMYPNLRSQIMKEANNISLSRNIGRLHYASDSKNGTDLGKAMYEHYKIKTNALRTS